MSVFSEKMVSLALGDSTQFCEKKIVFGLDNGLWLRTMVKMGVLTALHTYHLRNGSAPSRAQIHQNK